MSNKKYSELIISTTDTVLGIGGKVNDKIKKLIYEITGRDENKKLITKKILNTLKTKNLTNKKIYG